jgi:hypothetical protein
MRPEYHPLPPFACGGRRGDFEYRHHIERSFARACLPTGEAEVLGFFRQNKKSAAEIFAHFR